jgi:hypothetical protein
LCLIGVDVVPRLIKMYRAGAFPSDRLVHFYDFDEINQALADAQERRGHRTPPSHRVGEIKKERVPMAQASNRNCSLGKSRPAELPCTGLGQ